MTHLESAENSIRAALVEALENREDTWISELFDALGTIKKVRLGSPVRLTDNTSEWTAKNSEFNFNLSSDYIAAAAPVPFPSSYSEDVISFDQYTGGDIKIDTGGNDTITFS
jgi:hypothetical protein